MPVTVNRQISWLLAMPITLMLSAMWSAPGFAAGPDLVEAVKRQDQAAIAALLQQHVDVNHRNNAGETALHWAALRNDLSTVDLLIRAGANVNAANDLGVTPLWLACQNGKILLVQKLLTAGANPNQVMSTGESPLMRASRTGDVGVVKALLVDGANVNVKEAARGQTALMWAVAQHHPEVVRLLIEAGADLNARSREYTMTENFSGGTGRTPDQVVLRNQAYARAEYQGARSQTGRDLAVTEDYPRGGTTPLLFAARVGDVESARLLIAAGANVNAVAPDGMSALIMAIRSDRENVARLLIEQGADPNAAAVGYAPLHVAVLMRHLEVVKSLLASRADVNVRIARGTPVQRQGEDLTLPISLVGATPFFLAAKYAEPEMMRLLQAAGADTRASTENGTTPLMAAAGADWSSGSENRRGAYIYARRGITPEMVAETIESVKLLLSSGADVNEPDAEGNTPVFAAVQIGLNPLVQLLADSGAQLNVKNHAGQTPLKLARPNSGDGGNSAELLRKLGARE